MNPSKPTSDSLQRESGIQELWQPCPVGMIETSSNGQANNRPRRQFIRYTSGLGVAAVAAAFGLQKIVELNTEKPSLMEHFVSCLQVQSNLDDYILNVLDDGKLKIRIDYHLNELQCQTCCLLFDKRKLALAV